MQPKIATGVRPVLNISLHSICMGNVRLSQCSNEKMWRVHGNDVMMINNKIVTLASPNNNKNNNKKVINIDNNIFCFFIIYIRVVVEVM